MRALRDLWASASDAVRITVIVATVIIVLAALFLGLGVEWLTEFLDE